MPASVLVVEDDPAVRRVTDLPIAWLILTHMHPDHALGAAAFADHGIQIIGHANLGDAHGEGGW